MYPIILFMKNFYNEKIQDRTMLVFLFDESNYIKSHSIYELSDEQEIELVKDKTPNELVKRGLIKKIFGGIGNTVPSTTQ